MSGARAPKVHLVSLGCPRNTVDSERMLGLLRGNQYEITDDPRQAEVVVVNTCGFIAPAKEESIEAIMAAHRLKEEGRCRAVIVTGCLATRYEAELKAELIEADRILTIAQEKDIVRGVDAALERKRSHYIESAPRRALTPRHWAYLRIADGCDHQCAFCAIPAIRGGHRSEPLEALVAEAGRLAAAGVRELVLVAQDSLRYGADLYGRPQLVPLMRRLAAVEGIEWLRLMYTYPAFWTGEMIEFYARCEKMCAYIDMPLQHISDPVLRRMKRAATKEKTLELLARLRERIPGVGLRSSFIVGFPGESEEDFEELLEFVAATRFDHLSAFVYSPEEGTAACALGDQVEEETRLERYNRLIAVQEPISAAINDTFIGTRQKVLVDRLDRQGWYCARMERDAPEIDGRVLVGGGVAEVGNFAEVEITGAYAYELTGRVVESPCRGGCHGAKEEETGKDRAGAG